MPLSIWIWSFLAAKNTISNPIFHQKTICFCWKASEITILFWNMSVKIYFEFHTVGIILSVLIKIPNPILQREILFAGRWKASRIIENSLESRVLEKLESVKLKKGHWSNYPWIDGSIAASLDFLAAKTAARDWPEFIRTAVKIMVILRSSTNGKIMLGSKKEG